MTDINTGDSFSGANTAHELLRQLYSLVLHRELLKEPVFSELSHLLSNIASGDMYSAEAAYHALTSALIATDPRRVSGNLFSDYILSSIIEKENRFSKMAALGFLDEYVYAAMTHDLKILLPLLDRFDDQLQAIVDRRRESPPRRQEDKISLMADAAWGGNSVRTIKPPPPPEPQKEPQPGFSCMSWSYGGFDLRDTYVSDAALEEIYIRCLNGEPQGLTEDLWNFFNAYGTGVFLKSRGFTVNGHGKHMHLSPLPESQAETRDISAKTAAKAKSLDNVIAFMRGETAMNTLVSGARGVGKTTLVMSALYELPELRLIYIRGSEVKPKLRWALKAAAEQPLKFIIVIDDVHDQESFRAVETELMGGIMQPDNTLIYCIVPDFYDAPLFPNRITVELSLSELSELIHEHFLKQGRDMPLHEIQNACMDYQLETRLPLSYAALLPVIRVLETGTDIV